MNYERLIKTIENECKNRGISLYQLSRMSSVPISTIYGIFRRKNRAQIDTLYAILVALGLELSITSMENSEKDDGKRSSSWLEELQALPYEKKSLIKALVQYLKE